MIQVFIVLGLTLLIWIVLSVLVGKKGPEKIITIGKSEAALTALILYDPDPIYDLDNQISRSFAEGLAENGWKTKIVTVAAFENIKEESFDLYVFCANTYNWAPDKAIKDHIKNSQYLDKKNAVAITLGSGSTKRSKRMLEEMIREKNAILIDSRSFWLMKPNDESNNTGKSNIKTAVSMANTFGKEVAENLKKEKQELLKQ